MWNSRPRLFLIVKKKSRPGRLLYIFKAGTGRANGPAFPESLLESQKS
jgi:hypothetical protein